MCFDYKEGLKSNDVIVLAKAHVYELVIERNQRYNIIRCNKHDHPILDFISDKYVLKWCNEALEIIQK